ncbi:MAG: outer membrane protein assembly factor BamA [Pseudomonadales bacterium]
MKYYLLLLLFVTLNAGANEPFVVSDIRVEGLQRISAGSIFASLPINVGDTIDNVSIRNGIRTLFRTGNFDNLFIARDGNILVVTVEERPSINEINIEGNKAIETDALLEGLKNSGLSEGKVFKRSTLEGMKMELTRQYVSQGRYDARIETNVVSLPRNRVAVNIDIDEGTTASIKHINVVGNSVYNDEQVLDLFELKTTGWFSWMSSDDKYGKEKLTGDLDTLTSHYLDRGFIQFNIDSTQVSVTPDREAVYITVNISEGDKYEVGEVDLSGDLVLPEEQLRPFIFVQRGQTFSQALVTNTEEWLTKRLGNEGYNFAKVEGIPDINEEDHTVNIKFFIDPGKRTYVRRINFEGNTRTADEVLRREMRQMESAPASSVAIEQSRIRLERLGFFKEAKVETLEVPGSDDLIDLEYVVEEQASGSLGASVGFSQDSGVLIGANIQQDNFLGTGKRIGMSLNKSDFQTSISFNFVDPYHTKDGVSRGFSLYYREADLDEINVSRYTTNTLGANMNFSYPIRETERLGFSLGYSHTEIKAGFGAVQEIINSPRLLDVVNGDYTHYFDSQISATQFLNERIIYDAAEVPTPLFGSDGSVTEPNLVTDPADLGFEPGFLDVNGNTINNFTVTSSWTQSTLNRGRMATRGASQSVSLELTVPGSDSEYFKLIYNGQIFFPITPSWTLRLRTELGYGGGFGGDELPFFSHFYSGGFGSVRGFKSNTLGPHGTPARFYSPNEVAVTEIIEVGDTGCLGMATGEPCGDGTRVGQALAIDDKFSYVVVTDPTTGERFIPVFVFENESDPFGGNVLIESGAELLFPMPFIKDRRSVRTAFFIDVGNVFSTHCGQGQANCFNADLDELRYSYGIGLSWITGFGPLTFSYAKPINEGEEDKIESFQFSLGRSF